MWIQTYLTSRMETSKCINVLIIDSYINTQHTEERSRFFAQLFRVHYTFLKDKLGLKQWGNSYF